jgi:hypothetical protein
VEELGHQVNIALGVTIHGNPEPDASSSLIKAESSTGPCRLHLTREDEDFLRSMRICRAGMTW